MKNTLVFILFLLPFSPAYSQITLDATFPISGNFNGDLSIVKFGYAGEKITLFNQLDTSISIFNLNDVLEKTIHIPAALVTDYFDVIFISDNLFDLDSSIEYLLSAPIPGLPVSNSYVIKEDGSIMFTLDSSSIVSFSDANLISPFTSMAPTSAGTKLLMRKYNVGYQIYSLPGTIPCYECSNGVYTGNFTGSNPNENRETLSNPYPNPASNSTRVEYKLPNDVKDGEIVFYNSYGTEVKRFNVSAIFNCIYVSASDLPPGTYYYMLETAAGSSEGKKMVVIR